MEGSGFNYSELSSSKRILSQNNVMNETNNLLNKILLVGLVAIVIIVISINLFVSLSLI